jgi:HTH-type transcriptional regulator / antitoxin HipB
MGERKIERKMVNTAEVELNSSLRQARRARGLTQKELANRAGISQASISKVENDPTDASYSILRKIVVDGLGGELKLAIKL